MLQRSRLLLLAPPLCFLPLVRFEEGQALLLHSIFIFAHILVYRTVALLEKTEVGEFFVYLILTSHWSRLLHSLEIDLRDWIL